MSWTEFLGPVAGTPVIGGMVAAEWMRARVLYAPVTKRYFADPYPMYERLRRRDPVHRSYVAGGWVLSRYSDVETVLRDPRYSADERNFFLFDRIWRRRAKYRPDPEAEYRPSMLRLDGADHSRLRGLVNKAFTPRAVEKLRPRIEAIVAERIDAALGAGRFDAIGGLATPLPVTVIAEMLGIPEKDFGRFKAWSEDVVRILGLADGEDVRRARFAERDLAEYIDALARERRREPGDDLLSALVMAEDEGDKLSFEELVGTCILLLVAGNETTTNLIGNGLHALLRDPEAWRALCDDPDLAAEAVDEVLRYDAPVQLTSRFVVEEESFRGRRFKPRQQIVLLLGAANRDPERFPNPDRLLLDRAESRHMAFSQGQHFCLGAPLARLEAQVAFAALARRCPSLHVDPGAKLEWRRHTLLRGLHALPLVTS
jgi:cytochrome P450